MLSSPSWSLSNVDKDLNPFHRTRLPLELISEIAEYLGPHELIIFFENGILPSSFVKLRHYRFKRTMAIPSFTSLLAGESRPGSTTPLRTTLGTASH